MSLSQSIYDYIRKCPLIGSNISVRFNHLGSDPQEFSIEDIPEDPIVKRYIGMSERQKTFYLTSKEAYSESQRLNIEKSDFYENFYAWIEEQNKARNFPELKENQIPTKIECLTSGYLYTAESDTAQYQIHLRLTYLNKGER